MPLQNRVTPEGEIVASTARGTVLGNRGGCLHRPDKSLGKRRWVSKAWIACRLEFKGRRREVMSPGKYTELFFVDEATALAAGHRPCFECRRADAERFAEIFARVWEQTESDWPLEMARGRAKADAMDTVLHGERLTKDGGKRVFEAQVGCLPDGTFVRHEGKPAMIWRGGILPWSLEGYAGDRQEFLAKTVSVLTPRSIVAVILGGYVPSVHESALKLN